MDAIDTIDWGAYPHFNFVAAKHPDAIRFVQEHYYQQTYAILLCLTAPVLLLFLYQKRMRAALVTAMGFVISMGIIETCRLLIPRRRPPDAQELVGANEMLGSYPSAGVFLFMLVMIYLGIALWPWLRTRFTRSLFTTIAVLLTVTLAMSQFFLSLHFVSDVVGGIVGAAVVGYLTAKFADAPIAPPALLRDETAFKAI